MFFECGLMGNLSARYCFVFVALFVLFFSSFFSTSVLATEFVIDGETHSMYREFVVDSTMVSGTQTDIPLALSVIQDFGVTADAGNVRITDANDNPLPREIESYDPVTGKLMLWFKADVSDVSDAVFKMYFGNMSLIEPAVDSSYGSQNVWDSNYVGVWHMNNDPNTAGSGGIKDSTSNAYNGTPNGFSSGKLVSGDYSKGILFEGGQYITLGNQAALKTTSMTILAQYKPISTYYGYILATADNGVDDGYAVWLEGIKPKWTVFDASVDYYATTNSINDGVEHITTFDFQNGVAAHAYHDNESVVTDLTVGNVDYSGANDVRIGASILNTINLYSNLYELRYSDIVRSSNYTATTHNNLNNPTAIGTIPFYKSISDVSATSFENIFQAKQLIHINPSSDGILTDYQYKITINHQSPMNNDFSDIRFVTDTGVSVPYWIE